MRNLILLFLLLSFSAKAQLQLISEGSTNPDQLIASGGSPYTQGIPLTANATLQTLDNKAYIISGIITGAFDLTVDLAAGSTLTLSGANTYSGSTSVTGITGGELILTNTSGFRSTSLSVSAGVTLTIDASAFGSTGNAAPYLVFGSTATSNITVTGAGQVKFKGTKDKNYGVNISSDKSMVFNMSAGGLLNITGGIWSIGAVNAEAAFTDDNLGSLNVAEADTKFIISATTVQFDKVTGAGRIHRYEGAADDMTIKIGANNGTCDWDGQFYDAGSNKLQIEKMGAGTIAFTNTNLQGGTITISEGALSIGNGGDSGYIGSGDIVNNSRLILNRSNRPNTYRSIDLSNAISGSGDFVKKGNVLANLSGGATGILDYTGTTTVESGELTLKCKEMKNSGITVQNGATLTTYPNTINNGVITSSGPLSMTANSRMEFIFNHHETIAYAKLVVPNISAPDGFLMRFTGDNLFPSLTGEITLIGCTGTLPTRLPLVENLINQGFDSKKCIVLKWEQGRGLVGIITTGTSPVISPTYLNTCAGGTQRFTVTSGGTPATPAWTSSNPEVVSITNDGVAKLLYKGASKITYSNQAGCMVSTFVTARGHVIRPEDPNAAFCVGKRITLKAFDSPAGGSVSTRNPAWESRSNSVATVDTGDKGPGEPVAYVTLQAPGTTTIAFNYNYDGCLPEYRITVKESPTITPSTPVVCVGSTLTLTGSGTAATTNPWTSSATNFATIASTGVATGVANGETIITFASNNGCTATKLLNVKTAPVANAGAGKEICAGIGVAIGTPAQTGVTYSWNPATGLSASGVANPTANPTITTTYTLTANIANCSTTNQVEIKVNPQPTITSAQGAASSIRPVAIIELTASTDGTATSWATGNAAKVTIAAGTDPKKATATGVALGNAPITYTDAKGCIGTHLVTVTNKTGQTIDFDPIADKTVGGADFTLSARATSNLPITFSTKSDKVSITGSSVKIMKVGKVSIEADQAGNEAYTPAPQLSKTFCINPATPTTTYTESNKTLTSSSTEGNQWFLNEKAIPGATGRNHTVATDGSYTVKVTIEGCVSAPSVSRPILTTGDIADGEFQIYPNPVHDQLVIELPSHENGLASLFSITGQNIYSTAVAGKTIIDMKDFPVGIYILKIQIAGKMVVKKVVRN